MVDAKKEEQAEREKRSEDLKRVNGRMMQILPRKSELRQAIADASKTDKILGKTKPLEQELKRLEEESSALGPEQNRLKAEVQMDNADALSELQAMVQN